MTITRPAARIARRWKGLLLKSKNIDVKVSQPTRFAGRESNGDVLQFW
jgi:hypothetical protein